MSDIKKELEVAMEKGDCKVEILVLPLVVLYYLLKMNK